jgi:hypothetical protein
MDDIKSYERRFRRAGLPLLIEDYSATEDVFNRALPFLTLVFLVSVLGAINLDWSFGANVLAFLGGLAILVGVFGVVNLLRGRRFASIPRKLGVPELAVFVLLPTLLPLVFGGQLGSAAVTATQQLVVLGLTYAVVGFGVLSILRWAGARLFRELSSSLRLLARAIPLLMVFALLTFLTTEVWQAFSSMPRSFVFLVFGLVVALGVLFLGLRLPGEVDALEREAGDTDAPLRQSQRFNVGLVLFVSQGLQVLVVAVGVGLFFVVFGALAVGPAVRTSWIGSAGNVLWHVGVLGHRVEVTEELLRVAAAIAAFSGLYYAIATLTDALYRQEFLEALTTELRRTFQARSEYLRLRGVAH